MLILTDTLTASRVSTLKQMIAEALDEPDDIHITEYVACNYVRDQLNQYFDIECDQNKLRSLVFRIQKQMADNDGKTPRKEIKVVSESPQYPLNEDFIGELLRDIELSAVKGISITPVPENPNLLFPIIMVYL